MRESQAIVSIARAAFHTPLFPHPWSELQT